MQNLNLKNNYLYFLKSLVVLALFANLSSCGDGGTASTSASSGGTGTTGSIQLLVGSQQVPTSTIATTTLTAIVLDGSGQAITGKIVAFGKGNDTTAYFSGISNITNSNGVATATLNIGSDMTNRVINVTAAADGVSGTNSVTVTGTKIAVSGNTSLSLNAQTTLNIIVKDSSGASVTGVPLTITSANGNPIVLSPATGITNSTGQISATVTATNAGTAGSDVLTVSGAGATQAQTLTINSASFSFSAPTIVAPATTPEILVNTSTPVSITWTNPAPVVGQAVSFYTSRGTFSPTSNATNGSGVATANVTAASTGAAIITAQGPSGTPAATLNVIFVTSTATSITAQASPSTVAINPSGSSSNQAVISVVVRDASSNLVKNADVSFTQTADPSGGSLSAGSATTDITGTDSINYIAGSTSSPQNGVSIQATVNSIKGVAITPISTTVNLTVASQSLFVRLGYDNKVYVDTPVAGTNTLQFTALVTDAGGNTVPDGTQVRFILRPSVTVAFQKGSYSWNSVTSLWDQTISQSCASEDLNGNYQLDLLPTSEDMNGNGFLDPFGVAAVNATATTISGFAIAKVSYAKAYATWVQMVLEARAGTIGNDPPITSTFFLTGAASDYTVKASPPPGVVSPYGSAAGCNNHN